MSPGGGGRGGALPSPQRRTLSDIPWSPRPGAGAVVVISRECRLGELVPGCALSRRHTMHRTVVDVARGWGPGRCSPLPAEENVIGHSIESPPRSGGSRDDIPGMPARRVGSGVCPSPASYHASDRGSPRPGAGAVVLISRECRLGELVLGCAFSRRHTMHRTVGAPAPERVLSW